MKKKVILVGTIRVEAKTLKTYEKTKTSWKKSKRIFPELLAVTKLFKAHKNYKVLIDTKNPRWLKGQLSEKDQLQGARIAVLPNNEKLDKAFSLFAPHLTIHDQDSEDHWDLLYQNKGGTYSYCYTLEKKAKHKVRKYKKVDKFNKVYAKLTKNVTKALKDPSDHMALPLYTLLHTYMRVGNERYYKAHKHKGLTTLQKKDVKIKGNKITFNYLAKDGVPREIVQEFPTTYIKRMKTLLKAKKRTDFIFSNCITGKPLAEREFKKAFKRYCGEEFYPHIVRSHYATMQVKNYLKGKRKLDKDNVNMLYLSIASHLGHKRFSKKKGKWEQSYTVTVNNYIQPELVEKVKSISI